MEEFLILAIFACIGVIATRPRARKTTHARFVQGAKESGGATQVVGDSVRIAFPDGVQMDTRAVDDSLWVGVRFRMGEGPVFHVAPVTTEDDLMFESMEGKSIEWPKTRFTKLFAVRGREETNVRTLFSSAIRSWLSQWGRGIHIRSNGANIVFEVPAQTLRSRRRIATLVLWIRQFANHGTEYFFDITEQLGVSSAAVENGTEGNPRLHIDADTTLLLTRGVENVSVSARRRFHYDQEFEVSPESLRESEPSQLPAPVCRYLSSGVNAVVGGHGTFVYVTWRRRPDGAQIRAALRLFDALTANDCYVPYR